MHISGSGPQIKGTAHPLQGPTCYLGGLYSTLAMGCKVWLAGARLVGIWLGTHSEIALWPWAVHELSDSMN